MFGSGYFNIISRAEYTVKQTGTYIVLLYILIKSRLNIDFASVIEKQIKHL